MGEVTVRFAKYQGAGNDFVMVLDPGAGRPFGAAEVAALCDRRFGVGADGLIRITGDGSDGVPFFMDYVNADGSQAEMCGNGIRCVAAMLHDEGMAPGAAFPIDTRAGPKRVELDLREGRVVSVSVEMGTPAFARASIPMRGPAWEVFLGEPIELGPGWVAKASAVSMGNPHLVVFVDEDPTRVHVGHVGPVLEHDDRFPEGTNVEFVQTKGELLVARVWERGSGETMACGSGACAVAVAANEAGLVPPSAVVRFPGGDLAVERREDGSVRLSGPARRVFEGDVDPAHVLDPR
jgi:diaminopimelate epimerase